MSGYGGGFFGLLNVRIVIFVQMFLVHVEFKVKASIMGTLVFVFYNLYSFLKVSQVLQLTPLEIGVRQLFEESGGFEFVNL